MELTGQRQLSIDRAAAWAALNDPAILKASIPGCESIEKTGDNEYAVAVAAALGPVRAKFRGKLRLEDIVAPERYTMRFEGGGGAAGFANGSAKVTLADSEGGTRLTYTAAAQVGGRIAQVGNRLIDSAALKLADDFFAAFERAVGSPAGVPAPAQVKPRLSVVQYAIITVILVALVTAVWSVFR
jgi:carbon monoxide dehydrogenase subunit G